MQHFDYGGSDVELHCILRSEEAILKCVPMKEWKLLHFYFDVVNYLWLPLNEVSAPGHSPIGLVVACLNIILRTWQVQTLTYLLNSALRISYVIFRMDKDYRQCLAQLLCRECLFEHPVCFIH